MHRQHALISTIRALTPTIIEIDLVRQDGGQFPDFAPGQYATISFPRYRILRGERSFSIASPPTDRRTIQFGIRTSGKYTSALRGLRKGDTAMVAMPFGNFTLIPGRDKRAVLIAGGIGVTPFISMVRTATALGLSNNLTLLYSIRSLDDAAYRSELDAMQKKNPRLRVVYAVTDEKVRHEAEHIIPGFISRELLWWAMDEQPAKTSYFLCGPPVFMKAMTQSLKSLGLSETNIRTERFSAGSADYFERQSPIPKYVIAASVAGVLTLFAGVARIEQTKRETLLAQPLLRDTAAPSSTAANTNATSANRDVNGTVNANTSTSANTATTNAPRNVDTQPVIPKNTNSRSAPTMTKNVNIVTQPVQQPVRPRTTLS